MNEFGSAKLYLNRQYVQPYFSGISSMSRRINVMRLRLECLLLPLLLLFAPSAKCSGLEVAAESSWNQDTKWLTGRGYEDEEPQMELDRMRRSATRGREVDRFKRYIEIYFVVSYSAYRMEKIVNYSPRIRYFTKANATQRLAYVIKRANWMMRDLDIFLYPIGILVLTDASRDPFVKATDEVKYESTTTLNAEFSKLVRSLPENAGKSIDAIHVLVDRLDAGKLTRNGLAQRNSICSKSVAVSYGSFATMEAMIDFESDDYWTQQAITLAHELGHMMGAVHDESCDGEIHVMCSNTGSNSHPRTRFSEKSIRDIRTAPFDQLKDACLINKPQPGSWNSEMLKSNVCGNGILEAGEQCDCGLPQSRTDLSKCPGELHCNASFCTFLSYDSSKCWEGPCCDTSRRSSDPDFKAAGTSCNDNWLSGYYAVDRDCIDAVCNGRSAKCEVRNLEDGLSCDSGRGYCLQGRCKSLELQCKVAIGVTTPRSIFNISAQLSDRCLRWTPSKAYERHESNEDVRNHCLTSNQCAVAVARYRSVLNQTEKEQLLCSKLMCEVDSTFGSYRNERMPYYYLEKDETHRGCVHFNKDEPSIEPRIAEAIAVEDGTKCANNKVCYRGKCVGKQELRTYTTSKPRQPSTTRRTTISSRQLSSVATTARQRQRLTTVASAFSVGTQTQAVEITEEPPSDCEIHECFTEQQTKPESSSYVLVLVVSLTVLFLAILVILLVLHRKNVIKVSGGRKWNVPKFDSLLHFAKYIDPRPREPDMAAQIRPMSSTQKVTNSTSFGSLQIPTTTNSPAIHSSDFQIAKEPLRPQLQPPPAPLGYLSRPAKPPPAVPSVIATPAEALPRRLQPTPTKLTNTPAVHCEIGHLSSSSSSGVTKTATGPPLAPKPRLQKPPAPQPTKINSASYSTRIAGNVQQPMTQTKHLAAALENQITFGAPYTTGEAAFKPLLMRTNMLAPKPERRAPNITSGYIGKSSSNK